MPLPRSKIRLLPGLVIGILLVGQPASGGIVSDAMLLQSAVALVSPGTRAVPIDESIAEAIAHETTSERVAGLTFQADLTEGGGPQRAPREADLVIKKLAIDIKAVARLGTALVNRITASTLSEATNHDVTAAGEASVGSIHELVAADTDTLRNLADLSTALDGLSAVVEAQMSGLRELAAAGFGSAPVERLASRILIATASAFLMTLLACFLFRRAVVVRPA